MKDQPHIFPQNVIAVIWDFDKTLIPGYMQEPIFREYGVKESEFWQEVRDATAGYREKNDGQVSSELVYLNHIIDYVKAGKFAGLNNDKLRAFGANLQFFPGLPAFFKLLQQVFTDSNPSNSKYQKHEIKLEHYVISTGLRQIILGSKIAPYLSGVWGCELLEELGKNGEPELVKIGYVLDHTTKTRAVFEINKGVNIEQETIDVNARMPEEHRRVPISQMIYIADGPSDVPVFSVIKRYGGKSLAVHPPNVHSDAQKQKAYNQVYDLQEDKRVNHIGSADFTENSNTALWLKRTVFDIAERIVRRQQEAIQENVGKSPQHF